MATRKTPWKVRRDHKSNSYIIDFGYRDLRTIASDLIRELTRRAGAPDACVFTRSDGSPLTPNMVKNPHRRAREAIGMPGLRFHDLRHSFASQLVSSGTQLQAVQSLLGRSEITMTTPDAHLALTATSRKEGGCA